MRANKTLRYYSARIEKLSYLTSREKDILLERLDNKTLENIGNKYDLTAERIRQIELKAINKIKHRTGQMLLFNELLKED